MAQTTLGGLVVHTAGSLPDNGTVAPAFILTGVKLRDIELRQFEGKNVILNIYPSVDTNTCATSTREFNKRASEIKDTVVICVSKDLPFAFRRFCGAEGIDKVLTASDFRNRGFASDYGVELFTAHLLDSSPVPLWSSTRMVVSNTPNLFHPLMRNRIMMPHLLQSNNNQREPTRNTELANSIFPFSQKHLNKGLSTKYTTCPRPISCTPKQREFSI